VAYSVEDVVCDVEMAFDGIFYQLHYSIKRSVGQLAAQLAPLFSLCSVK